MAGGQGIRAGRAYVEMGANDAGLRAGLKAAEARLKSFGAGIARVGAGLAGLGVAVGTPLLVAAKSFADAGSALNDMSVRTGVSVEALSELGHAAQQTGTDMGTVEGAIRKMQKAIGAAQGGNQLAREGFKKIGLTIKDLQGLKPEEQFELIAEKMGAIQDPTLKAATAMKLFGKSGTALIPLIDDYDALAKEARDLGLVMSTQDAQAADTLGDAMDNVTALMGRAIQIIGASLAPLLTDLAGTLIRLGKTTLDWINANRPLIVSVFKIAAGVVVAGVALTAFGAAIYGLGAVLGGIVAGVTALGAVLGAIVSPLGLVTIGLTAGAVAFFKYSDAGQTALADLRADAEAAFGGIADALKAGDIQLAGEILWSALKVQFLQGTQFLRGVWADWGNALVDVMHSISFQLARDWVNFTSDLKGTWGETIAAMIKAVAPFAGVIEQITGKKLSVAIDQGLAALGVNQNAAGGNRQAQLQALSDQQAVDKEARRRASAEGLAGGAADLQAEKDKLAALLEQARAEAAGVAGPGVGPVAARAGGLRAAGAAGNLEATSTFSAAAVAGLGVGGGLAQRQLDEQKETTKELRKLRQEAKDRDELS